MGDSVNCIPMPVLGEEEPQPGLESCARPKILGRGGLGRTGPQEVAVRARDAIDPDGAVKRTLIVFCPRDGRSRSRKACDDCGAFRGAGDGGAVVCAAKPAVGTDVDSLSSLAARSQVGMAMNDVRCLTVNTRLTTEVFDPPRPLVVVDDGGIPVGVVRGEARNALPPDARAGDVMVPVRTVSERVTLSALLSRMLTWRARYVVVVDDAHVATGLISDVVALTWLTRRLRG